MIASFIIGFHSARMDNLTQTLYFLDKYHLETIQECELVLICQDKCEEIIKENWKSQQQFNMEAECMQLPIVTNFGINQSQSEKIIVLESDRILPKGYFSSVIAQLKNGVQITTKNMIKFAKPFTNEEIDSKEWKTTQDFNHEHRSENNEIGLRNMWSGNTAFMKSDFMNAGKMDESYKGYGWADSDMTYTMEKIGVQSIYRDELELHLWHPSATYGDGDQKQMFIDNGLRFCKKWEKDHPDWFKKEIKNHCRKNILI